MKKCQPITIKLTSGAQRVVFPEGGAVVGIVHRNALQLIVEFDTSANSGERWFILVGNDESIPDQHRYIGTISGYGDMRHIYEVKE